MNHSQGTNEKIEPEPKEAPSLCSGGMANCIQNSDRYSLDGWRFNNSDSTKSYDSDMFLHKWGIPDELGDKYVVICGRSSTETESKRNSKSQEQQLSGSLNGRQSGSCESLYTTDGSSTTGATSTEMSSSSSENQLDFSPTKVMATMHAMWRDETPMSYSLSTCDSQSLTDRIDNLSPADQLALIGMLEMESTPYTTTDDDDTIDTKCDARHWDDGLQWIDSKCDARRFEDRLQWIDGKCDARHFKDRLQWIDNKCDERHWEDRLQWMLSNDFCSLEKCGEKVDMSRSEDEKDDAAYKHHKMNWLVPYIVSGNSSIRESFSFDEDDLYSTNAEAKRTSSHRVATSVTWWDTKDRNKQNENVADKHDISSYGKTSPQQEREQEARQDTFAKNDENKGGDVVNSVGKVEKPLSTSDANRGSPRKKYNTLGSDTNDEHDKSLDHVQDILEASDKSAEKCEVKESIEQTQDHSDKNTREEKEFENDQVQEKPDTSDDGRHSYETDESQELAQDASAKNTEDEDDLKERLDIAEVTSDLSNEHGLSFEYEESSDHSDVTSDMNLNGSRDKLQDFSGTSDEVDRGYETEEGLELTQDALITNHEKSLDRLDRLNQVHISCSSESLEEVLDALDFNSEDEDELEESCDEDEDISATSDENEWSSETEESLEEEPDSPNTNAEDEYGTENSLLDYTHDTYSSLDRSLLEKTQDTLSTLEVQEDQEYEDRFLGTFQPIGPTNACRVFINDLQISSDTRIILSRTSEDFDDGSHDDKLPKHSDFLTKLQRSVIGLFSFPSILTLCDVKKGRNASTSDNSHSELDPDEVESRTITLLYSAIRNRDTEGALACLKQFPGECKTWVTCCDTISNEFKLISSPQRLKYLPLHTACLSCSPLPLVKELIRIYPDAIKKRAGNYKYPIHMACDAGVGPDVMCYLIQAWPESIYARDGDNNIPLCALLQNKPLSPDQDAIMMILLASFQELQESQNRFYQTNVKRSLN